MTNNPVMIGRLLARFELADAVGRGPVLQVPPADPDRLAEAWSRSVITRAHA